MFASAISIDNLFAHNVCESETSADRPKVPFAVTSHIFDILRYMLVTLFPTNLNSQLLSFT